MIKISGGSARLGQLIALLFFIPFLLFLTYIILSKNCTMEGFFFLVPTIIISLLIVRRSFKFADIYREKSVFLSKKIFSSMTLTTTDIIEVGESLWPFTYYIIVYEKKRKKILFSSSTSDWFTKMISNDGSNSLNKIKEQFSIYENKK